MQSAYNLIKTTSLCRNLESSARRYPHQAARVFFGQVFSQDADVLQKAERPAACLQRLEVKKGDRVVLGMQNCPQLVITHLAILRATAVMVLPPSHRGMVSEQDFIDWCRDNRAVYKVPRVVRAR